MSNTSQERNASTALASGLNSLMAATDAFRNTRALLLLALTLVTAALVGGTLGYIGATNFSGWLAGLGMLLSFVVFFYGLNAVGIMMMRDAQGQGSGTMMDAVLLSLFTSHRLLGVAVLEMLILLAAVVVIAIVLFICKIPALGPLLFTVVFPVAAIIFGVLVFSLFYVILPLAGPAVWAGCSVFQVIARLNVIARKKLVPVILNQLILMFITAFCASLIFFVVMTGMMFTTSMSAGIIGVGGLDLGAIMTPGAMDGIGGSGHMAAGAIGGGLLFAIAAVIPLLICTKGMCIIYLNATGDLDFAQAEAQLGSGLETVRKKADEARERARQLAEQQRSRMQAEQPLPAIATPAAAPESVCPGCKAPVAADDAFCGECGHKLR